MLTTLTDSIEFWIVFSTILITVGAYKLLTKQNGEQIKALGEKFDSIRLDIKLDQVKMQSNFEHMNEKINRIENDTTITRAKSNELSEAIAKIQVKLQNLEREGA